MKLYKRWLLYGIIHSQTIQVESATRGTFSFSLTCSLMTMHNWSLGECEFFLEKKILNNFIVVVVWMLC